MSYLEYTVKHVPTGFAKILHLNWPLTILLAAVSGVGFLMLYSVAGGSFNPWAEPQMKRFALGIALMIAAGMVPIWLWRNLAGVAYFGTVILLIGVELFGAVGMGAQRWIELGSFRLQPSELMKITLVMMLAAYYDWLPPKKTSRPLWVLLPVLMILIPTALVLKQPDLGTAILLMAAGGGLMFLAGVHWGYFAVVIAGAVGLVSAVFQSRGTPWQLIKDYQFRRIDTFIDPSTDPLGAGYHITQSKIALGSGGWTGRGFMQGTQSRLNFLPEKHTDFIFTTLAEEFGFVGGFSLLGLYALIIVFCVAAALINKDRFSSLLTLGIALNFFLFFAVNMSMVMGLAPVVGVPLPLVSYGGSAMLVLLLAFGLVQSAHVHRPR
ncbi:MAG: rod shape-determining protein RodA [Sulfitobacter litoralis]|jgi:rod shape determining protein RodA|uniref:Peptidoglycan glycosyltransferase MrdB n=2 Tax=root TaxID=1 RepID=A0A1H0H780_9RHOB|nr:MULTISPECIES: rod shape-determining protein RodA [Sulfitobacter]MBQ0717104.1 rod shape-determining protein RodA [Sulfitobacter litoralis]MBQ0766406.1 rod shape-determining protein RodA [Sulfitobacter litoralis]MCF7727077.1 rod shape-determining protein RodA [Sulfitobacter sp. M22]MCF7778454.1 rod shape-determining protein RodA [Sulfitobacter sp. M220]SDO14997.1 cell elongation-specific peptidoglycan biosynthesis regulator RodA [Sulfitobacter litoralis]|tara:strand:- start:696 stop:1835 length:1140 start_codon:yes stop_codon:yes gene_type:complete